MKKFSVKSAINEVLYLTKLHKESIIYSVKIDLPEEIVLAGNKVIFQGILFKLLEKASQAYQVNNFQNKIILFTAKIENSQTISFSITHGGRGLSILEKTIGTDKLFIFREKHSRSDLSQISHTMKKEFKGKIEIISKKQKGSTFKCYFPLNQ